MAVETDWHPKGSEIPDGPGIYLFRDPKGRVVYVGKAKSLKSRVPHHFGMPIDPRTQSMVDSASSVEWIVTANEVEALQLEVTLIKEHQPRFNVRYRDDKSYPYLAVTLSEEVPRAMVVRGRKKKGDRYYGPFAHAYAIRETLDLLLRVFPIRSCSPGVFEGARKSGRPCLLYHIGRCSAPCVSEVSPEEHLSLVKRFCDFMDGNHAPVTKELESLMKRSSDELEYEQAARYRDKLSAVRRVIERQQMVTERREDLDAIAFSGDEIESAFQVFFVRRGRVVGRKGFIVDRVEEMSEPELVASFIETLYADQEVPPLILVPVEPSGRQVLELWLSMSRASQTRVRIPERGSKRALLKTVTENAEESFTRNRLKRASDFAARTNALAALQEHLDLPEAPLRIECYDISNLGPTEVVGSMVVFEDGLPKKSDYRKFQIKSVEGQDDVSSMGEVIHRRFARYLLERDKPKERRKSKFAYEPGLVLIDGGKGQLNRAVEVLSELGVVGIPIAALAKRFEEIYIPGESASRVIPRGSEALYLLQRVRDEAHRFAVGYQRKRRSKRMTQSVLDRLPGVGPSRRKALLRQFGSARRVQMADADEIATVPGIGPQLARRIYEILRAGGYE